MGVVLRWVCIVVLAVLVVGCDQQWAIEKFEPEEESAFARGVLENLRMQEFDAIEEVFDPAQIGADFRSQLAYMSSLFPEGEPVGTPDTVGVQWHRFGDQAQYILRYEYEFPESWVVGTVMLRSDLSGMTVSGLFVDPREISVTELHAFNLEDKGLVHVLFLCLVAVVPLFILYVLVRVFRTPGLGKRKFLWAVFVLFSFVQVTLNWTTGDININPLSFQLFGAGFLTGGPYAPWTFFVGIPVGAILFMVMRRSGNKDDTDQSSPKTEGVSVSE